MTKIFTQKTIANQNRMIFVEGKMRKHENITNPMLKNKNTGN